MKIDFKKDLITEKEYDFKGWRNSYHEFKKRKSGNYYNSEICDYYHKEKYDKGIVEILFEKGDKRVPICPITGSFVSYRLQGKIIFGEYSSLTSHSQRNKYIAENSESYKAHIERMKIERKGEGNPMFGKEVWNKGLTKEDDKRIKKISNDRKGIVFSEETLKRMSESAKAREIHGHTGHKHSEETKQKLREITIARYKNGIFPQTNSKPHREVRSLIEQIGFKDWEEEFSYEGFSFDFRIGDTLIEVQGDFFHANPNTRHSGGTHPIQVKNIARDERKRKSVYSRKEYNLLEIWENDIENNIEQVKEKIECLKK